MAVMPWRGRGAGGEGDSLIQERDVNSTRVRALLSCFTIILCIIIFDQRPTQISKYFVSWHGGIFYLMNWTRTNEIYYDKGFNSSKSRHHWVAVLTQSSNCINTLHRDINQQKVPTNKRVTYSTDTFSCRYCIHYLLNNRYSKTTK